MKNFWYWHAETVMAGAFFLLAALALGLCVYGAIAEGRAWEEFTETTNAR